MNIVKLKTGKTVPASVLEATMSTLRLLAESDPVALFDFVGLCKDSDNYLIWGRAIDKLKALSLIQPDGSVLSDVREIVLAASLTLDSPVSDCTE